VRALVLGGLLALVSCRAASDGTCPAADVGDLVSAGPITVDDDDDGLDDAFELALVRKHMPFLAHHPDDGCGLAGVVFRARPHPDDGALVAVAFTQLFAADCGLNAHDGDNEAFGATIDARLPAPAGLTALVAIGHQGTLCERTTTCGTCAGLPACDRVDGRAVLYFSKDKHAGAVDIGAGCSFGSCLDSCALPAEGADLDVVLVNAGEPERPLLSDLDVDAGGFVDGRWPDSLRGYDPWADAAFGGAGVVSLDLVDPLLLTPPCTCAP
jgi:hypothetical protein